MTEPVLALIILLLFIWRIKKGFSNGIMKEIVTLVSGVVALICVALIFLAVSSVVVRAVSTLTLCVIGLVLLGTFFKLCSLIFKPILALSNISVISGFNKLLGAVLGAAEACVLSGVLYFIFNYMGIYAL